MKKLLISLASLTFAFGATTTPIALLMREGNVDHSIINGIKHYDISEIFKSKTFILPKSSEVEKKDFIWINDFSNTKKKEFYLEKLIKLNIKAEFDVPEIVSKLVNKLSLNLSRENNEAHSIHFNFTVPNNTVLKFSTDKDFIIDINQSEKFQIIGEYNTILFDKNTNISLDFARNLRDQIDLTVLNTSSIKIAEGQILQAKATLTVNGEQQDFTENSSIRAIKAAWDFSEGSTYKIKLDFKEFKKIFKEDGVLQIYLSIGYADLLGENKTQEFKVTINNKYGLLNEVKFSSSDEQKKLNSELNNFVSGQDNELSFKMDKNKFNEKLGIYEDVFNFSLESADGDVIDGSLPEINVQDGEYKVFDGDIDITNENDFTVTELAPIYGVVDKVTKIVKRNYQLSFTNYGKVFDNENLKFIFKNFNENSEKIKDFSIDVKVKDAYFGLEHEEKYEWFMENPGYTKKRFTVEDVGSYLHKMPIGIYRDDSALKNVKIDLSTSFESKTDDGLNGMAGNTKAIPFLSASPFVKYRPDYQTGTSSTNLNLYDFGRTYNKEEVLPTQVKHSINEDKVLSMSFMADNENLHNDAMSNVATFGYYKLLRGSDKILFVEPPYGTVDLMVQNGFFSEFDFHIVKGEKLKLGYQYYLEVNITYFNLARFGAWDISSGDDGGMDGKIAKNPELLDPDSFWEHTNNDDTLTEMIHELKNKTLLAKFDLNYSWTGGKY